MKRKFYEYLTSRCEGKTEYLDNKQLREEYKPRENCPSHIQLTLWMAEFKKNVFKITDEDERIRLLFVLGVQITKPLYSELNEKAYVEWNRNRVITKYISNDGRLQFERNPSETDEGDNQEQDDRHQDEPIPNKRPKIEEEAPDAKRQKSFHGATTGPQVQDVKREIPDEQNFEFAQINVENPGNVEEIKPDIGLLEQHPPIPAKPILSLAAHNSFLKSIQTLISTQKLPVDPKITQKIGATRGSMDRMQLLGAPNPNEVQIDEFVTAIQHSVSVARRSSYSPCPGESRRLRDFLVCLQFSIAHLMMEELKELEAKLKESIEDPANLNREIPINKTLKVMDSILDLMVPN